MKVYKLLYELVLFLLRLRESELNSKLVMVLDEIKDFFLLVGTKQAKPQANTS